MIQHGTYAIEVIADDSGNWCGNSMYYPTPEAAREAAIDLFHRWLMVKRWRTVKLLTSWGGYTVRTTVEVMEA